MTPPEPTAPKRLWLLYVGGFMGPFGGGVVNTMLPELAGGLGTSVQSASLSITWYLAPFAALLLVSGTLATRWGPATVVRVGYAVYALSSLACALVSTLSPFLVARAVQGGSNAFLTPVLVTLVVAATPRKRLGRALGTFAAAQASGQAFSPLAGGLAAAVDWRIAFLASALAATALAVATPSGPRPAPDTPLASWRALLNVRLGSTAVLSATSQLAAGFVVLAAALVASDRFGLGPEARGLVVVAFGIAGMLSARLAGAWSDRVGMWVVGMTASTALAIAALVGQVTPYLWLLVVAVFVAGAGATSVRILANSFAIDSTPANASGATSISQAAQFGGGALAPLLLPMFARSPLQVGVVLAIVVLLGMVVVSLPRAHRQPPRPGGTMEA